MTVATPISVVFFDLDNTLYDHRRAAREALAELYRRYDVAAGGTAVEEFQRLFFEINQRLWLKLATGDIDVATLRAERFARLFGAAAAPCDDAAALGAEYLDIYLGFQYPLAGAEDVLRELQPVIPLGLLTNGFSDIQRAKVERLGWGPYFKWIIIAEEVDAFKPARAIYDKVCEAAATPPGRILYVGDSPVEDIIAARRAGLITAWLRREGPETARWAAEAEADYELADIRDAAPLAKALATPA
jgi:HAD superfamily hydrolase (TIGR01549 family)